MSLIVKALGTPKVVQHFDAAGFEFVGSSPQEFAAHIKAEIAKWGKVVKAANIPLE